MNAEPKLYALLAEWKDPRDLVAAAEKTYAAGYRKLDAFTPFPVEGLAEAIGFHKNRMPLIVLCGGILGAFTAIGMMTYSSVYAYPLNVGGRPLFSWPAFVPITFELTVLFASIAAVLGMLGLNGLPMPYHPVFNAPGFAMASRSRFFLCIQADDPLFDPVATRAFLESLNPRHIREAPL